MPKSIDTISILLLQIRERHDVQEHERWCVIEQGGIESAQVRSLNVINDPVIPDGELDSDVVIIGGAGVHSVTKTYEFTERLGHVVRRLVDEGRPLLGLCWGHQFIAQALGGEVITDRSRSEVGTFDVTLTDVGRSDQLLSGLPPVFPAHMGHNDRVSALPPDAIELAHSELCGNQVFRIAEKPVYGAQFHVELTPQRLRERLAVYQAQYLADQPPLTGDHDDRLRETPEANGLIRRFLELYA